MQSNGYRTFVFPWTHFSSLNIARIIYISRKHLWYHKSCSHLQFPIFRHYQRNICYSTEEQLQLFNLIQDMQIDRKGKIPISIIRKEYELKLKEAESQKMKKSQKRQSKRKSLSVKQ
ncbi:MAG: hypothetical protein K9W44_07875 [Candidatus Lokiarchaeota archaeon]|nr:hypothetical protein [Candidatus Harpocratesius repetitus]